jgi:hypothetical protein
MSLSHNPEPGIVKAIEELKDSAEKVSASSTRLSWVMVFLAIVQIIIAFTKP